MKLALVGNPNTGKSTVFQKLTGTSVSVGNLAGVTVDVAAAPCKHAGAESWLLHDLPGIYNLHAQTEDGRITQRVLLDAQHEHHPDVILLVADTRTLQGQLFLILQIRELGIPCMLLLNDMHPTGPSRSELQAQAQRLEKDLDLPVRVINAHSDNPSAWTTAWSPLLAAPKACAAIRTVPASLEAGVHALQPIIPGGTPGLCAMCSMNNTPAWLSPRGPTGLAIGRNTMDSAAGMQLEEAAERMAQIKQILSLRPQPPSHRHNACLGWHPRASGVGSAGLAHLLFDVPSRLQLGHGAHGPAGRLDGFKHRRHQGCLARHVVAQFDCDGALAGARGHPDFLTPNHVIFGFTALLEHSGAMARSRIRGGPVPAQAGLGGRGTVSLVGGMACAVPAVMAARALPDRRERLLTILVTPMMTCSARLPVYAFLIAFVVPDGTVWGMNRQGLFLYGLYLASTAATLVMAWLLHRALPKEDLRVEHAEEWPAYRLPKLSLVASNMVRQGAIFVRSAGQVILILSVVLWGLGFVG